MPVVMEPGASGRSFSLIAGVNCAPRAALSRDKSIDIAIVNNMPDSALEATERQFIGLLARASDRMTVRVRLFALPGVARSPATQLYIANHYADIGDLWDAPVDGLIVTGTDPRAPLAREPYWPVFKVLVDWAARNTVSTVWSCLAAHAAVLHLDGIERHALAAKCFGVFRCERIANHPLTAASPELWQVPHSRWNDLGEQALAARGYTLLSRSPEAGADLFVKEAGSLFVFLQGHPEYELPTLLREFRRDVGRFLRQETRNFPDPPRHYFDGETVQRLQAFKVRALADRRDGLLEEFPETGLREPLASAWRAGAARLYHNWLAAIATRRDVRLVPADAPERLVGSYPE
jgi:homoserine O-succinyltransferase/O-acetyltransferase